MEWLLKSICEELGLPSNASSRSATCFPIYIGDDVSDEDAFQELTKGRGVGIVVRREAPARDSTSASMWLSDPTEVASFLSQFLPAEDEGGVGGDAQPDPTINPKGGLKGGSKRAEGGGRRWLSVRCARREKDKSTVEEERTRYAYACSFTGLGIRTMVARYKCNTVMFHQYALSTMHAYT